jgi:hypothetical protein
MGADAGAMKREKCKEGFEANEQAAKHRKPRQSNNRRGFYQTHTHLNLKGRKPNYRFRPLVLCLGRYLGITCLFSKKSVIIDQVIGEFLTVDGGVFEVGIISEIRIGKIGRLEKLGVLEIGIPVEGGVGKTYTFGKLRVFENGIAIKAGIGKIHILWEFRVLEVRLSSDDGGGKIDRRIESRVFEPYFFFEF